MGALDLTRLVQPEITSARQWRCWLAGLRCHELSLQDWLPATERLVVIAPHPDDGMLASGGLITMHRAQGGRVLLVAATDCESHVLPTRLKALLRPGDVVVSTWEHDGHPGHDATGLATRTACAAVGCTFLAVPVQMWCWATPGDERVPWLRLRGLPLGAGECSLKQAALATCRAQPPSSTTEPGAALGLALEDRTTWRTEYYFI